MNYVSPPRREREELLHPLEGVKDEAGRFICIRSRVVKEYSRPAAGKEDPLPCDLRPAHILKKTVDYLLGKVAVRVDYTWSDLYDFVFDRLRAVRQDMVIQSIGGHDGIELLEKIVRFHIYAGYRLCTQPMSVYDPQINDQHTQECLKRLISLYRVVPPDHAHQEEFESLYLMFNLGQTDALMHFFDLPKHIRELPLVQQAYRISLAHILTNTIRCLRLMEPEKSKRYPLFVCAAHRHLSSIQSKSLHVLSVGYNSKSFAYPLDKLTRLLWYRDTAQASESCRQHNLAIRDNSSVLFQKSAFRYPDKMLHSHHPEIDDVLSSIHLADIFLKGGVTLDACRLDEVT
ncbi:SAC3 domain-containing protein 1-like isoform X2 [Pecten maximus]|uniref:SAC3 domain-containing protein 1-like isoform X2 n=1 Tax=Pecten maximus TaxID=6579 RepID=UPI001458CB30|nr:SAC3 domain-containing protein 1-like isoform X2 [Pecten maximus]